MGALKAFQNKKLLFVRAHEPQNAVELRGCSLIPQFDS